MKKQVFFILLFFCYDFAFSQCSTFSIDSTSSTSTSCNGNSDGSASVVSIANGSGNYSYLWSTGGTTAQISNLNAGTYSVTVTDNSYGCVDSTTITVSDGFSIATTSTNISCNGLNDGTATVLVSSSGGGSGTTGNYCSSSPLLSMACNMENVSLTGDNISINNATTGLADQYEDYTNLYADLTTGQSYTITVSLGVEASQTQPSAYPSGGKVFIDWNMDGDFIDFGEEVGEIASAPPPNTMSILFTVPTTALNGTTRMRVVSQYNNSSFGPCDNTAWFGATEDYTLNINASTPASYLWSNGDTTSQISNLSAGTYIVTVSDTNNCSVTDSVIITEPSAISVAATTTNVLCNGESTGTAALTLNGGTGTLTPDWGIVNPTALAAGTHVYTITDSNSCTYTDSIIITEPTAISATATITDVSCNGGSNGTATLTLSGGTGTLTADWGIVNPIGLIAGTYNFTITDSNGCTYTSSVTITEPAAIVASATITNVSCNGGNDGVATLTLSGGTGTLSVNWGTANPNALSVGTYSFTVTDSNSCTYTNSVTITEPQIITATPNITNVSCFGGSDGMVAMSLSGGTGTLSVSWANGNPNAFAAGTYSFTITDINTCSLTDSVTITEPTAISASASTTNVSCNGGNNGTATLTLSGGTGTISADWGLLNPTTLVAGTHTYTITDSNNCSLTDSVTITEPLALTTSYTIENVSCFNGSDGSVTLYIAGGTINYVVTAFGFTLPLLGGIDTAASTSIMPAGVPAGIYPFVVTDANNCSTADTVYITQPTQLSSSFSQNNLSACGLANGSIDASILGGIQPYTFTWSSGDTTEDISNLSAGQYTLIVTDSNNCSIFDTLIITQPSNNLLVSATTSNYNNYQISCNGGTDSITSTVSGGTPGYSYLWSDGQTTATANNLVAGNYTLTITDLNSCDYTISITLNQPTLLSNNVVSANVLCNGSSDGIISVNVSGGVPNYNTNWGGIANPNALSVGNYIITTTDSNGCVAVDSVEIMQPNLLSGSIMITSNYNGQDVSCNGGGDGSVMASIFGGILPYNYLWSSGGTASTEDSLSAGTYSLTITDSNNCVTTLNTTLTEPTTLDLTLNATNGSCDGSCDGSLSATISGGTPTYSYNWSNNDTMPVTDSLCVGTYNLVIIDVNGCMIFDTTFISEPNALSISITTDSALCYGGMGLATVYPIGGTPAYSYLWSSGDSNQSASLLAGNYIILVTDTNNCFVSDSLFIGQADSMVVNSTITNMTCFGLNNGSITINILSGGLAPFTYSNDNGVTFQSVNTFFNLATGSYTMVIMDNNNCIASVSGSVSQPQELVFTISATDATCYGYCDGTAILNISGGTPFGGTPFYIEDWGGLNQMALCEGLVNISVTDQNGCIATNSVTINEPPPLIVNISQFGNILDAGAGFASYQWLDDNLNPINGATSQQFTPQTTGEYSVLVTDANGCSATSFSIMFIADGIAEINTLLNIYPNPTKDKLNIQYEGFGITSLIILDVGGNIVLQKNDILSAGENTLQLNLLYLPKGMYVLQLISDKKIINHSVILQ